MNNTTDYDRIPAKLRRWSWEAFKFMLSNGAAVEDIIYPNGISTYRHPPIFITIPDITSMKPKPKKYVQLELL